MSYAKRTDMAGDAQARVVAEYRDMPEFMALIGQLGGQVQLVEDALWDLFQSSLLDSATDIWLDYLGAIVGEAREGWSDTDFRRFIKARILVNRSSGTIDEVLAVVALVLGEAVTSVFTLPGGSAEEFYPGAMLLVLEVTNNPSEALRSRLCRIAARTRPAGVRLLINSSPSSTNTFTVGDSDEPTDLIVALDFTGASGVIDPFGSMIVQGTDSHALGTLIGGAAGSSGTLFLSSVSGGPFIDGEDLTVPSSWLASADGEDYPVPAFDSLEGFGNSDDGAPGGMLASGDLA